MTFFSYIVFFSVPLFAWHVIIGCLYAGFFSCSIVDGKYFSYKPTEFETIFHIKRAEIFWRNCFKYLFGFERPSMPLHLHLFVAFSAIAHIGALFFMIVGALGVYDFIDIDSLMTNTE